MACVSTYGRASHGQRSRYGEVRSHVRANGMGLVVRGRRRNGKVWNALPDAWQRKTDRVGLSRWFAFAKGIAAFITIWHRRALGTLYQVLWEGMFKGQSPANLAKLRLTAAPTRAEDVVGERTGVTASVQQLRAATRNTQELVVTVLMDEHLRKVARMLALLLKPVQEAHSMQLKRCRSCGENQLYRRARGCGVESGAFRVGCGVGEPRRMGLIQAMVLSGVGIVGVHGVAEGMACQFHSASSGRCEADKTSGGKERG